MQSAPPTSRPPDPVLARYQASMRRSRAIYYAILTVIVAALGTWVGIAWSRGEATHATLHTFATPPPTVAVQPPSQTQRLAWQTHARAAIGSPQYAGTIVTYGTHTVGGRNALTGKPTWTYTRTDRTVCSAAQLDGITIAIYRNSGNCDEVSAFFSDTGARKWTRTLDMDGMPLNGTPAYQVLDTPATLLVTSPSVIYAIDPTTGYNRWTYTRFGCRIQHVVLGSAGALISQTCSNRVQCADPKFCGPGPQLLLRNGVNGRSDNDTRNPDQFIWLRRGDTDVPVSADDTLVSSVDPTGSVLHVRGSTDGAQTQAISLTPVTAGLGPVTAIETGTAEVIWLSGVMYAIRPDATTPEWHADSASPPIVTSPANESPPDLTTSRVTVPTSTGVGLIDGNDGTTIQTYALRPPGPGSLVYPVGAGFLVTGPTGTVSYR